MKNLFLSVTIVLNCIVCIAQIVVTNPLCENRNFPIGLDITESELSWQLVSSVRNTMQTAYEIRVAENKADIIKGRTLIWNSGKIVADQSLHVAYAGGKLQSPKKYYWQVRVRDNYGKVSEWSYSVPCLLV